MNRRCGLSWKSSTPILPPCTSRPSTRDGTTRSIAWAKTWRYGFRGAPLAERASVIEERMQRLRESTPFITGGIEQAWNAALDARIDAEPTWIHGDLHARNVLVENGAITGVIDWGDVAVGDRATDL